MNVINIGILAHVDAGKTSLTERILFETHVIAAPGRVDHGTTRTDSLELERKRGITIKSSVVSFPIHGLKVNLIDTPGHADFIAEVERSLLVLDGVVLVISAVEGVQAQTKVIMTVLKRLRMPTIIFVNKIDRTGARDEAVLASIHEKLGVLALLLTRVQDIGSPEATVAAIPFEPPEPAFLEHCLEVVSDAGDERLLQAYLEGDRVTAGAVMAAVRERVARASLYPVYFGSAISGAGVPELLAGVAEWLPPPPPKDTDEHAGIVFKIETDASGEKICYLRLFSGSLHMRDNVEISRPEPRAGGAFSSGKVTRLHGFANGRDALVDAVHAGDLAKVWGLSGARIGDFVGLKPARVTPSLFAQPQIESVATAADPSRAYELYRALLVLADEDPWIRVRRGEDGQLYMHLFGEVQKEVIEATLLDRFGIDVRFAGSTVMCIEKPRSTGQALESMGDEGNPFLATVGFRVESAQEERGVAYQLAVELGSLPLAFHKAIEDTVRDTLEQGLRGWDVRAVRVTLTHTGYDSVASTAADFRRLVPLVLMHALSLAGTAVYEPVHEFELTVPVASMSQAIYHLTLFGGAVRGTSIQSETCLVQGTIGVAGTDGFRRTLYSFTKGEGVLVVEPGGYTEIKGDVPSRARTDHNPLDREEYLLHIPRHA